MLQHHHVVNTTSVDAGHSLGGGYAIAMLLHLLSRLSTANNSWLANLKLDGVYTFGSPLMLTDPSDVGARDFRSFISSQLQLPAACIPRCWFLASCLSAVASCS